MLKCRNQKFLPVRYRIGLWVKDSLEIYQMLAPMCWRELHCRIEIDHAVARASACTSATAKAITAGDHDN
jgi:hypothetical protein